jgi:hypothetical protein
MHSPRWRRYPLAASRIIIITITGTGINWQNRIGEEKHQKEDRRSGESGKLTPPLHISQCSNYN